MKAKKRTFLVMTSIVAWVILPLGAYGEEVTSAPSPTPVPESMK